MPRIVFVTKENRYAEFLELVKRDYARLRFADGKERTYPIRHFRLTDFAEDLKIEKGEIEI